MKFLAWVILIFAVIWVLRSKARAAQQRAREEAAAAPRARTSLPEAEVMVSCAHCGVHFPASEAFRDAAGTAFCCDEHRRQHTGTRA